MSVEIERNVDQELLASWSGDMRRMGELLMEKWSHKPTVDANTGKARVVDWINAEQVGRWSMPKLKNDHAKLQMAILLETQSRFNGPLLQAIQATETSNLALPTVFSLPIIRRTYAQIMNQDWLVTQAMQGPTSYVFWLDFLRNADTNQNILSVDYNFFLGAEDSVPAAGTMQLTRALVTAFKNILGVTWSTEAEEDARAILNLDVPGALLEAFTGELVRDIMARQLQAIVTASVTGVSQGAQLVNPWVGPNTQHQFANIGATSLTDYKQKVYNTLVDADTDFRKANRIPSDAIVAGYGLAGFLQKINTATQSAAPQPDNMGSIGITDYGTYAGRWKVWGTDMIGDNQGFLYKANPSPIEASHVFAPYRPIEVMPLVYAAYDTTTGAYANEDKWTRNIRERSGYVVTKPYGFQPILGPSLGLSF